VSDGAVRLSDEAATPEGLVRIFADGTAWLYVCQPNATPIQRLDLGDAKARIVRARLSKQTPEQP